LVDIKALKREDSDWSQQRYCNLLQGGAGAGTRILFGNATGGGRYPHGKMT